MLKTSCIYILTYVNVFHLKLLALENVNITNDFGIETKREASMIHSSKQN